jgi:hypothetical protein
VRPVDAERVEHGHAVSCHVESEYGTGGTGTAQPGVEELGHVDSDAVEMRREAAVSVVVPDDEKPLSASS